MRCVKRWTVGTAACAALLSNGCSSSETRQSRNFEANPDWRISGDSAVLELLWNGPNPMLAVKGRGRVEVDAPPLEVQGEVEALRLDLRVPRTPGDVRWDGELLVSVQDPTSPTGFRYVGGKSLTPLEEGRFSRIEIPVPQHLRNHFVGSPRVSRFPCL